MKKSITKNYIYNLAYQLLIVITPIITTPYLSRILGASGVGEVSFVESIVSYFTLFATLGITTFGQREISYYQDDIDKRSVVFFNIFILKLIVSFSILIIYVLTALVYFKSKIYLIFVFNILAIMFNVTWFFQGLEEFKMIAIRNFIYKTLSIVSIFTFVKNSTDIYKYCFIVAFFTFLSDIAIIPYLKGQIHCIKMSDIKPFANITTVLSLFLPTIAIQVYTVLDKTMIGIITQNTLENGYYEQSTKISKFLLLIVTSIGTVAAPRIGYYFNKSDAESLEKLLYKSYRIVLMLAVPMALGLFSVASNMIPWFLGYEFKKSILLTQILSFLIIFIGISNITGIQYMVPTGRQKLLTISVACGAALNFILNIILIKMYQSVGAAISSIVAECMITCIQLFLVKNEISITFIIKSAVKYIISGIIMFIVLNLFIIKMFTPHMANSLIICGIGTTIYFLTLFILKDELLYEALTIFIDKVHRITKSTN